METLTRVMARTIYRIDLQNPPLQQLTRKDKVIKKFQRKVSSGDILKKDTTSTTNTLTIGSNKLQHRHAQGKSMPPVHRFDEGGTAADVASMASGTKQMNRQSLTRSASEPGMSALPLSTPNPKTPYHHLPQVHSESYVPTHELTANTDYKELIRHEESTVKEQHHKDSKCDKCFQILLLFKLFFIVVFHILVKSPSHLPILL